MFVYLIINETNLKTYVGKTINPDTRFSEHLRSARNNSTMVIHQAIRKYGPSCFHYVIWEKYETEQDSLDGEKYWISKLDSTVDGNGYNMTDGGENASLSEAFKQKLSESVKLYFSRQSSRDRQSQAIRRYFETPGARERQSQLISAYAASPDGQEAYSRKAKEQFSSPEARLRASERTKKMHKENPEIGRAISTKLKLHFESPVARQANKDRQTDIWSCPEKRKLKSEQTQKRLDTPEMLEYKKQVVDLYQEGLPLSDIAKTVNRNWTTIRTILIKAGVYVSRESKKNAK